MEDHLVQLFDSSLYYAVIAQVLVSPMNSFHVLVTIASTATPVPPSGLDVPQGFSLCD
jgi:hypothetical protein